MKFLPALFSGLAGAVVLTILHESFRHTITDAPRMDKLGMQGLAKSIDKLNMPVPGDDKMHQVTLVGDVAGNALYYSLVGLFPRKPVVAGVALGLTAGVGALTLPAALGLNKNYGNASLKMQTLTIFLYLAGGFVAGGMYKMIKGRGENIRRQKVQKIIRALK